MITLFLTIVIILAIIPIGFYIYKLAKEEKEYQAEDERNAEKDVIVIKKEAPQVMQIADLEAMINDASNNFEKLEEAKDKVDDAIKDAMTKKDLQKIKECNNLFKKIEALESKLKG